MTAQRPDRDCRASRAAARRPGAGRGPAGHRRHPRADRPPRLRCERAGADSPAPGRAREALRGRGVREWTGGGGRPPDRLDRLDRVCRQPRLRAAARRAPPKRWSTRRSRPGPSACTRSPIASTPRRCSRCACGARTRARSSPSTGAAPPTRAARWWPSPRSSWRRWRRGSSRAAAARCSRFARRCRSTRAAGSAGCSPTTRRPIALYAGDDLSDVDAFAGLRDVLGDGAVCIGVRSDETPPELETSADAMVDGPPGVRELLEDLLLR